jgi:hypothetical protein
VEPSSSSLLFLAASPERVDGDLLLLLDLEETSSASLVMVNGDLLLRLLDREGDLAASSETVDGVLLL